MSRIHLAVREKQQAQLEQLIRHGVGEMVSALWRDAPDDSPPLSHVAIVGNTVMHHLFCGIDLEPLSGFPFEPIRDGLQTLTASSLDWSLPAGVEVRFLPCLGGFVGSDVLAGVLATGLHVKESLAVFIDLGTNGEIVVGNRDRLLCASTAAGPAFEGARISQGMQAATGAISHVRADGEGWTCDVLGDRTPIGICGSGLVDAVAVGLDLGKIAPTGKMQDGSNAWVLADPVAITQLDIRELQLAKGAILAGIGILLEMLGFTHDDVAHVYLAGAFGNYVDPASARRIGLPFSTEIVESMGNTALRGARMDCFAETRGESANDDLVERIEHVSLAANPRFQDLYVEAMAFPSGSD